MTGRPIHDTLATSERWMGTFAAQLISGEEHYRQVVQHQMLRARHSLWLSTANVKAMLVEQPGGFVPVVQVLSRLAADGVEVRLLHADTPSAPFLAALRHHRHPRLELRVCPRVHFKVVLVDATWLYLGSANLTGAGLGAKDRDRRNFEVGIITSDPRTADDVTALYQEIWSGAACATCKLRHACPKPLDGGPASTPRAPGRRRRR